MDEGVSDCKMKLEVSGGGRLVVKVLWVAVFGIFLLVPWKFEVLRRKFY